MSQLDEAFRTVAAPRILELREQFATVEQQRRTASIGMWIFLMTEVMMFGGLFMAYTVYRFQSPQAFDIGSAHMASNLGAINTAILICSSFTMAVAVYSAELGKQRMVMLLLILTMLIGGIFLGIKFTEYYEHWLDHKVPGFWFEFEGPHPAKVQMFFLFYFIMTGLHSIHMIIGIGILSVLLFRTFLGSFTPAYHTPLEIGGLYWSFVDIVWVFLYAIFYIPGLHLK